MASFFVRSRPTANRAGSTAYTLGQKIVSTSAVAFLGICFEVTTAGTSAAGGEPAWNTTVGGTTTDGGVTWTTRGAAGIWLASKAYAVGDRVVKVSQTARNSASSAVWDCTTAGTSGGSEPTWPTTITAGTTTQTDGGVTWTARAASTWDNANPFLYGVVKDTTNATIKVSAGDTIYVSSGHAESWVPPSFTHNFLDLPGTFSSPLKVLCVDDTAQPSSPSTLATSASVTLASGATTSYLWITGVAYIYGITFKNQTASGTGHVGVFANSSSFASNIAIKLEACSLQLTGSNSASSQIAFGMNGGTTTKAAVELVNTTLSFCNASQQVMLYPCRFNWRNTASAIAGTAPTSGLITTNNGALGAGSVVLDGLDLSALGSNAIFSNTYYTGAYDFSVRNCKLGASFTLVTAPAASNTGPSTPVIDIVNCDSAGTNYKLHREHGQGTIDHELTKIMTGGANDGTTGISWKMVSNANAQWAFPLPSFDLLAWNDNSGSSKTATVEMLTDSATQLNNDDVWLELTYLKDSGDPLGGFANNSKSNILASNAAQPTSSVTWTTTGITNVMKQTLQVSFTPQLKGPVRGRVHLGKASTTIYVNPVLSIT